MKNTKQDVYEREVGDWTVVVRLDPRSAYRPHGCRVVLFGCPGAPRSLCQQDTVAHGIEYAEALTCEELERFTAD